MRPDREPLPIIAAIAGACLAPAAALAAEGIVDGSRTVCTHSEAALPRIVQVLYDDPGNPVPCKVLYEKDGAVDEIAAARNSAGHCEKTERKVVRNLAAGGYDCKHTFMGALASADRSVTLDLFSGDAADVVPAPDAASTGDAFANAGDRLAPTGGTRTDAADRLAPEDAATDPVGASSGHGETAGEPSDMTTKRTADGGDTTHEHTFTHSHPIDDSDVAVLHAHTTVPSIPPVVDAPDAAPNGATDEALAAGPDGSEDPARPADTNGPSTRTRTDDLDGPPDEALAAGISRDSRSAASSRPSLTRSATPSGRLAILSRPLPGQSEAHRFAAEFRRNFPNVATRVAETDGAWHVALGVGDDADALEGALLTLGGDARALFEITPLANDAADALGYVQDDWARYAIASCYADGRRTADELADCASVVVDAEAFVNCLGGGLCAPARFGEGTDVTAIDLASVLAADDPVAAARQQVMNRVDGCENEDAGDEAAFAECAALAVLDDDHRAVYDCYRRSASDLAVLECAGGDAVADYAQAYDRCGATGYEAAACLLDASGNDHLESAAFCLAYEEAAEIATCTLEAGLADDEAMVLGCLTDHAEGSERAVCLARERLDDTGYAAAQCATLASSASDYGLCVGERSGALSAETLHAARCLQGADVAPDTLLDCAGGQFVGEDIRGCLEHGVRDTRCFDPETLISRVADDAVEDYLQFASLDNEIARFRQELYALEGGDLGQILASEGGAASMKVIDDAAKKASGGLRGLFGLKPK